MNKQRLQKIEDKVKDAITPNDYYPITGWIEEGYLYVIKSPFILERMEALDREIIEGYLAYTGVRVDPEDKDIVAEITEDTFTLVGMDKPIRYNAITWTDGDNRN